MSKNKKNTSGFVFSTDPNFQFPTEPEETVDDLSPSQQVLRVHIDRKQRGGKEVTLITGWEGTEESLKELGKFLKTKCGVGGTTKDFEIIIQGNHREKIVQLLLDQGYSKTKKAGG